MLRGHSVHYRCPQALVRLNIAYGKYFEKKKKEKRKIQHFRSSTVQDAKLRFDRGFQKRKDRRDNLQTFRRNSTISVSEVAGGMNK